MIEENKKEDLIEEDNKEDSIEEDNKEDSIEEDNKEGLNLYVLIIVCLINLLIGAGFISETGDFVLVFASVFLGIPFGFIMNISYLFFCLNRLSNNIVYIFFPMIAILTFFSPIIINNIQGDEKYYKIADKYMKDNYPNQDYQIVSYDRNRNEAGDNYLDFDIKFNDGKNTEFVLSYDYFSNDYYDEYKNVEEGNELLKDKWINNYFNEDEYVAVIEKSDGSYGDLNIALYKNYIRDNTIEDVTDKLFDIYKHYNESIHKLDLNVYIIDENILEEETRDYILNRYYSFDSKYNENNYNCNFDVFDSYSVDYDYVKYEIKEELQNLFQNCI